MTTAITHFSKARAELALATNVDEVKDIKDKAEALRAYAQQQGESLEMQNQCAEIKIRAERRAGELLAETPPKHTGRPGKNSSADTTNLSLADVGISRDQSSQWQKIAAMPEEPFERHVAETKAAKAELTTAGTLRAAKAESMGVHYASDSAEWYTPEGIIMRVVSLFGEIDLDPCSNSQGPPSVPAKKHYTIKDNGLSQPWAGRVYMNPPYGRELEAWVVYLRAQYAEGAVTDAMALVPSRTDTVWFRRLRQYPRCFIWGRLKFSGHQNSAPFPSMAVYLGRDQAAFVSTFKDIGDIYKCVQ